MNNQLADIHCDDLAIVDGQKMLLNVDVQPQQLDQWLQVHSSDVQRLLKQNGALLIRSLPISGSKKLGRVISQLLGDELLEYSYRSTPRTKMRGSVYTSSEYHPDETIFLHNENAYANEWAMRIAFYCLKPAENGGATPIGDSRKVYQAIDADIREKFERKKLLYVRNYGDIDLPWSEVFQTEDKSEVEQYCRKNDIHFEWLDNDRLRTKQLANAAYLHPASKEKVWFNQAHLFHISNLSDENRQSLLSTFKLEDLPRNVYYGDGEQIEAEVLSHIRKAYQDNTITFDWQTGDLMLLDNMLFCHGRLPFEGNRRILVGMTSPINAADPTLCAI